jgi:hypothetical protein
MGELEIRNGELGIFSYELGIGGWKLSQISTRYVTDSCRKSLPFLRHDVVTNYYFYCYIQKLNCNKYLLKLLQN